MFKPPALGPPPHQQALEMSSDQVVKLHEAHGSGCPSQGRRHTSMVMFFAIIVNNAATVAKESSLGRAAH